MQPNAKQIVVMVLAVLAFIAAATSQMEPLIGIAAAKAISGGAAFFGGLIAAALAPFLSNSSVVKDAGSLTGVEVQVSRAAAPGIAALAVAAQDNGVAPAPGEGQAVAQVAQGTTV